MGSGAQPDPYQQQPGQAQPPQWGQPQAPQPDPYQQQWGQPQAPQPDPYQQQWGQSQQPPAGPGGYDPNQFGGLPGQSVDKGSVRSGLPLARIGLIATVVLLAGLGGFAIWRALSSPGGAATPEEAAAEVFDSIENEDVLGVVEIMLPSERESMVEPVTDIMIELARLDIIADDTVEGDQLNNFTGLTVDFPDEGQPGALVYDVEPLGSSEDIRWVTVTDGMMTVTFDPQELEDGLGERFSEWIDADDLTTTGSGIETETVDLGDEYDFGTPLQFAVVEEDGSWYVSLWYTVAGFATDFEAPDLALAPTPAGAGSPEEAASQWVESLIELDLLTVMTLMDPDEFRAAYDYWGRYGPDLVSGAADLRVDAEREGVRWDVVSVAASSEDRNGRRLATIDELVLAVTSTADGAEADLTVGLNSDGLRVDGTIQGGPVEVAISQERATGQGVIEGESFEFDIDLVAYEGFAELGPDRFQFSRDGDCLVITTNGESDRLCEEELGTDPAAAFDLQQDYQNFLDDIGTPGLTVVERDGRWYVSGFPTYAYAIVDFLKAVDKDEFDEFVDSYVDLIEDMETPGF